MGQRQLLLYGHISTVRKRDTSCTYVLHARQHQEQTGTEQKTRRDGVDQGRESELICWAMGEMDVESGWQWDAIQIQ